MWSVEEKRNYQVDWRESAPNLAYSEHRGLTVELKIS
jgi:hypothetical protein